MTFPPAGDPIGIVDTMIGFTTDPTKLYANLQTFLRDQESRDMQMPAQYMFRDVPNKELARGADAVELTLHEMDRHGVDVGLVSVSGLPESAEQA